MMDEYAGLSPVHRAMVQARTAHSDTTGITDGDPHFVIDTVSRKIINNSGKDTLVQYDHNSERLTFELPRYIEGHDMSNCNKVAISYLDGTAAGLYEVDDLAVKEADTEKVAFTWLISSNVTQIVGKIAFAIEFECVQEGGEITYKWHTGVNEDMRVISTITNDATVAQENVDVLEKWKQELFSRKIPTKTSELENDSHFLTADTEISWGRKADTTIGERSVALGTNVEASGTYSHAEGSGTASGYYSHAEGAATTASGFYSHAEGSNTTASGYYSHAEGYRATAKGKYSHAEGTGQALEDNSHAEGSGTASGYYSHAEGAATTASGYYSHAEGSNTTALGEYSHSEGFKVEARGMYSHAEGILTTASGTCSHTEGSNTIARGDHQHVQGKYNVEDTNKKYAHIVGGGTSENKRKNIHTLDWDGNAEYAGDVSATVNGKKVFMSTLADIFLQPGAAAHNAICRGKKLGNALTSEMLASIRDGSFNDLYVCDYIETEDNIYRFMDFDYFLGCCSSASGGRIEKHHAILVPDKVMSSSAIDNYPEVTQPKETHMYVNKLPEITQTLKGIFGNNNVAIMDRVITKTVNGESTGWDWVNVGADLLTEVMVMGHSSWGQWVGFQTGIMKGQLAGFRYSHSLMCSNEDYWLRDKRSATNYALISSDGYSSSDTGSLQHGVRPFFVIW